MNVNVKELNELQQALNSFKFEREFLSEEINKPDLFNLFNPAALICIRRFLQKSDRIFLELFMIVENLKSEKNG